MGLALVGAAWCFLQKEQNTTVSLQVDLTDFQFPAHKILDSTRNKLRMFLFLLLYRSVFSVCIDLSKTVGLLSDVQAAEDESVFLLHACAHNPTGIDPTQNQWAELSKLMKSKRHTAFFDCAYQVTTANCICRTAY